MPSEEEMHAAYAGGLAAARASRLPEANPYPIKSSLAVQWAIGWGRAWSGLSGLDRQRCQKTSLRGSRRSTVS